MALKAGRVGLNKELVDEFGYLKGDMPTGEYYTKTQADNKFETKTHVNNNFQKKTLEIPLETLMGSKLTVEDSLNTLNEIQKTRQPKTLEVPIELLSGSVLTVEGALQGLTEEKFNKAEQRVLGAKNLLENKTASQTVNGITFTVNADGSVKANGTASAQATLSVRPSYLGVYNIIDEDVILSGCPSGGSSSKYDIIFYDETAKVGYYDYGDGVEIPSSVYGHNFNITIRIESGQTVSNLMFYPMLRLASDPDDTYVPYAMTNKELTDMMTIQESSCSDFISGASVSENRNYLFKCGKIVQLLLQLNDVTVSTAWTDIVCKIPEGYRPKVEFRSLDFISNNRFRVQPNGELNLGNTVSSVGVLFSATWITS